jgi:hypothetical protein
MYEASYFSVTLEWLVRPDSLCRFLRLDKYLLIPRLYQVYFRKLNFIIDGTSPFN